MQFSIQEVKGQLPCVILVFWPLFITPNLRDKKEEFGHISHLGGYEVGDSNLGCPP